MHVANDGSFYLTIEETNEERKRLGLKPLKLNNEQKVTLVTPSDRNGKEDESETLKRIELTKVKRKEREMKRLQGLDDEEEETPKLKQKKKKDANKMVFDFEDEEETLTNNVNIEPKSSNAKVYDLSSSKPVIASDFEAVKKKKKRNIRVKEKSSDDTSGGDLLAMMEVNASKILDDEEVHHASRLTERITRREQDLLLEEKEKDKKYQEAIDKAHDQSKVLQSSFNSMITKQEEQEEENILGGKVYNTTKEFVKTVSAEKNKVTPDTSVHVKKEQTEPETTKINKRKQKTMSLKSKDDQVDKMEEESSHEAENGQAENSEVVVKTEDMADEEMKLIEEPLVSDGLLATIDFAHRQGFLEDKRVGRSGKDRSHVEERTKKRVFKDEDDDFVIVHLDKYGRELTPKEAYVQFSQSYQGNFPKKKKLAKQMKKMELEKRRNAGSSDDFRVMEKVMKEMQQPFIEISKDSYAKTLEVRSQISKDTKPKKKKVKREESEVKE